MIRPERVPLPRADFSLPASPVITTNFDPVIETVFERANKNFETMVLGRRVDGAISALHRNSRLLIKLHGDHSFRQDRVLTLEEYTAAYGSPDPEFVDLTLPLPSLLRLVLETRPLLFLGCSLAADRTVKVIRRVAKDYPDVAHYAIVALPADDAEAVRRDRDLAELGIRPIWYPAGHHENIERILGYLLGKQTEPRPSRGAEEAAEPAIQEDAQEFLRAELERAGYPASRVRHVHLSGPVQPTNHGGVYRAREKDTSIVVKLTRRNLCSLPALKRIVGKRFSGSEQDVSASVVTPSWIGESSEFVIEILPHAPGVPLDRMLERSPSRVTGDLLAEIFNSLMRAAVAMHGHGLIHRDITPSNVLIAVSAGRVSLKVVDCSFACGVDDSAQIPISRAGYTDPEQVRGNAYPGSDYYGIAATCYFLVNGAPPRPDRSSEFEQGLARLDIGGYDAQYEFSSDLYHQSGRYGTPSDVFRALLNHEAKGRLSDVRDALFVTSSRAALLHPLTGVLEVGRTGLIFIREATYRAVPRPEVDKAVAAELSVANSLSPELRAYLLARSWERKVV